MRHKDILLEGLNQPREEIAKSKKVSFARNHDVAYIYPWSPTKFLLFGKLSEEQLKRKKSENNENIVPILKKSNYVEYDTLHEMRQTLNELKSINEKRIKRPRDQTNSISDSFSLSNIFTEYDPPNHLEEINVDELYTVPPILPSMAIFSPNEQKDFLTNAPCESLTPPSCLVPIAQNHNYKKQLSSSFSLLGHGLDNITDEKKSSLPQLATTKLSEALFGCIRQGEDEHVICYNARPRKYLRMPSIESNDSFSVTSIHKSSPHRSQISQRYAITESDLENIQHLNEEEFICPEITSKQRRPLPLLREAKNRTTKKKKKNGQNQTKKKEGKIDTTTKLKIKPKVNQVGDTTKKSSCKQEARKSGPSILQLHLSPKDIRSGCCK